MVKSRFNVLFSILLYVAITLRYIFLIAISISDAKQITCVLRPNQYSDTYKRFHKLNRNNAIYSIERILCFTW